MSSRPFIPNGPQVSRSLNISDATLGRGCDSGVVLKIFGDTKSCATIIAQEFVTDPGGAKLSGTTLSGLTVPLNPDDAANKEYVDNLVSSIKWKEPAILSTTSDIILSGNQLIDNVMTKNGYRILVKNQVNQVENGIYIASDSVWERSQDLPVGSSASGSVIWIERGDTQSESTYVCNSMSESDIVGINDLTWIQFGSSSIIAGDGLTKTGDVLDVNVDDSTIEINGSNSLEVKDSGITNAKLVNDSVTVNAGVGLSGGGTVALGSSITLNATSSGVNILYFGYDSVGSLSVTDSDQTLPINVNSIIDLGYINAAGEITILTTGTYEIDYRMQFQSVNRDGSINASITGSVEKNAVLVPGSESSSFMTEENGDIISVGFGKSILLDITSGDIIRLRFSRTLGTTVCETRPGQSSLLIKYIR